MAFSVSTSTFSRIMGLGLVLLIAGGLMGCTSDDASSDAPAPEATNRSAVENGANAATMAPPDSLQASVVQAVRGIDQMRSQLATTFDPDDVTKETFARVCKPVGMRAKAVAQDSGWVVQQLAKKYRNPAHQLDSLAAIAHQMFENSPDTDAIWRQTSMNGTPGWRYFQRITVEPSCLACHGARADRPAFIKAGYPDDRAYGFAPGDVRGLYSVFIPFHTPDMTHTPNATSNSGTAPNAQISLMRP